VTKRAKVKHRPRPGSREAKLLARWYELDELYLEIGAAAIALQAEKRKVVQKLGYQPRRPKGQGRP
jgi:hypothetical protein